MILRGWEPLTDCGIGVGLIAFLVSHLRSFFQASAKLGLLTKEEDTIPGQADSIGAPKNTFLETHFREPNINARLFFRLISRIYVSRFSLWYLKTAQKQ